jgi:type II secretory pathway component PulF
MLMKINVYVMLKTIMFTMQNGNSLSSGIQLLATNAQTKQERKAYYKIYEDLKDGLSFSQSLYKHKVGSLDVVQFITMAEKGISFKLALQRIVNYIGIKEAFERESNEQITLPFIYFFLAALIVIAVKFFIIPYQMKQALGYDHEILKIINNHLEIAQLMTDGLFVALSIVAAYFFILLFSLFSQSRFVQAMAKQVSLFLPITSKIIIYFEKFILFNMIGEMLKSGISFKKAVESAIKTTTVRKFKYAFLDTLDKIKYDGKFILHNDLYDNIEKGLLTGIGSSSQTGEVMLEMSNRAKEDALSLTAKFFRLITIISILLMAFAVFIEFYTVVLTQMLIEKGLIDLTKGMH